MLVIVDMQNRILDPNDENYVQGANTIVPKILHRLEKARESGEMVLFTRDIPIEHKNYYALPPEALIEVRELTEKYEQEKNHIEVVGVELSLCVLANALALQGALPEADFYINSELVAGNQLNEATLSLLKKFNIEIK
jgi:nicotinamidase-related amidase